MSEGTGEPTEAPATWENLLDGEVKKLAGRALGDQELAEEGENQVEAAQEVREEYKHER